MQRIVGRDHIIVRSAVEAPPDVVPLGWHVHMLHLRKTNGRVDPAWYLYDYFVAFYSRSDTWQSCNARAVGLLYDYLRAKLPTIQEYAAAEKAKAVVRGYYTALTNGTIIGTNDPPGLYLYPQPLDRIHRYINCIDKILSWMSKEGRITLFLEDAWDHRLLKHFTPENS
jgi:hypothetical protein